MSKMTPTLPSAAYKLYYLLNNNIHKILQFLKSYPIEC